jgi:hypothetical protein
LRPGIPVTDSRWKPYFHSCVIRSLPEGSAVPQTFRGNAKFYPQTELSSRPKRTRKRSGASAVFFCAQLGNNGLGAPHPRFPVKCRGFRGLHAPFLRERRTRGHVQGSVQEIRGISLVFREMWDTTAISGKLSVHNEHLRSRFVGRSPNNSVGKSAITGRAMSVDPGRTTPRQTPGPTERPRATHTKPACTLPSA